MADRGRWVPNKSILILIHKSFFHFPWHKRTCNFKHLVVMSNKFLFPMPSCAERTRPDVIVQTVSAGWRQMMQINIWIFSFYCWQSKAKHINLQLFLLRYLASTVRSGAGLEVGTHVLLPRPPSHLQQARFVVGDLGIKWLHYLQNSERGNLASVGADDNDDSRRLKVIDKDGL